VKAGDKIAEKAQTRDIFGRDERGKYLDQKSFMEKRNALNQKE